MFQKAKAILVTCATILTLTLGAARPAQAQSTEEKFQDLFLTAGYATAFGAAVGTAMLAWTSNPAENLRYVAMGASLGFIGGSILGTYVIFSPGIADVNDDNSTSQYAAATIPERGLMVRPVFDRKTGSFAALETGMTLAQF